MENLKCAYAKARQGKTEKAEVLEFSSQLQFNLASILEALTTEKYQWGALPKIRDFWT